MKRLLLFIALAVATVTGFSKPVTPSAALRVAQQFWSQQGLRNAAGLEARPDLMPLSRLYCFEQADGTGFVIVAADDIATPILGYSVEHGLGKSVNPEARYWLTCLSQEIAYGVNHRWEADPVVSQTWEALLSGSPTPTDYATAVAPLVATTWDQSYPYNLLCPSDSYGSGGHCYTGCAATAMAQIMKKWNHPSAGYGSHSYNAASYGTQSANFGTTTYQWSSMPNALYSSSTNAQINAVATLMYHCGVSIEMNYGPYGSSAQTNSYGLLSDISCENALLLNFGYQNTIHSVWREGIDAIQWADYLATDIDAGRPVLYTGFDTDAGHAFVCDGYNNSNYFHFNWGWSGYCDGYYPLSALNPSGSGAGGNPTGTYNLRQRVVLGIQPCTGTTATCTLSASASQGTVTGTGTYPFGDTAVLLANASTNYRFDHWSDGSYNNPRYVYMNGSLTLTAVYESLHGDTLRYDNGQFTGYGYGSNSGTTTWGVKFNYADYSGYTSLNKVMIFDRTSGSYTVNVYTGGTTAPSTLAATKTVSLSGSGEWACVTLNSPVDITNCQTLWITVTSSASYPATITLSHCGNAGGSMYRSGSSWISLASDWDQYYTFMVRGIVSSGSSNTHTLTAVPSSSTYGTVEGGGSYADGAEATLLAWANSGYRFTQWNDGVLDNPRTVTVTGNATYTAQYASVVSVDTVRYDNGHHVSTLGAGGEMHWTIKIDPVAYGSHQILKAVKLYDCEADSYTLTVHQGGTTAPGTQVCSQSFTLSGNENWATVTLGSPVSLNPGQPLWIVIHSYSADYPAAYTEFAGTDNSSLVSLDGTSWDPIYDYGYYSSWMLRAVLGTAATTHTLTAVPSSSTYGTVEGGGSYADGAEATLLARANSGYRFTQWNDGVLDNPRTVTVTGNATYTAQYASVVSVDTVRYDNGHFVQSMGAGGEMYWAMKVDPVAMGGFQHLRAIKIYDYAAGSYTLTVHQGGTTAPGTQMGSQSFNLSGTGNWVTVTLGSPVTTNPGQPLWIVLHNSGASYPAACADFAGTDNSCYVSLDGSAWEPLYNYGYYHSWMLRAVFEHETATYTVTATSDNPMMGTVEGGGQYTEGSTVTLTAMAYSGYHFVRWSDNATYNPYVFPATQNRTLVAYFAADQGIGEVEAVEVVVSPNPTTGQVRVEAANLKSVEVTDLWGRTLQTVTDGAVVDLTNLPSGSYLLKIVTDRATTTQRIIKQ